MRSRGLQLAIVIALGVGIGLLMTRPWQGAEEPEARDVPVVANDDAGVTQVTESATSLPSLAELKSGPIEPPPSRSFRLPPMAAPVVERKPKADAKRPLPPLLVPRHWLLRGTGPSGYDVKSDRDEVFTGQASVQLVSHDKNVAATKFGSLMQTVLADPWVGKRVEFSMSTRSAEFRRHFELWIRATDSGGAVIAHGHVESLYGKPEWQKATVVMDIPWSAAEVAYGINLDGAGKVWVDNAQVKVVDKSIELAGRTRPSELGVIVQTADRNGPLAMPANLDFEDVVPADEAFREIPQDELGKTRF